MARLRWGRGYRDIGWLKVLPILGRRRVLGLRGLVLRGWGLVLLGRRRLIISRLL